MPGFRNFSDVLDAHDKGRVFRSTFRKTTSNALPVGEWADLTRSPGIPGPFFYAGTERAFAPVTSLDGGIRHGQSVAPAIKEMTRFLWLPSSNAVFCGWMVDVLGFWPFVAMDDVGVDLPLDSTVPPPQRWRDGDGVMLHLEVAAPPTSVPFNNVAVSYTNSNGVAGRLTGPCRLQTAALANGSMLASSTSTPQSLGPMLPLDAGDTGIQSVQSIRIDGLGDVGLMTLVASRLVAHLPSFQGGAAGWPAMAAESAAYLRPSIPAIVDDGAFLSLIVSTQGGALAPLIGQADFCWR